MARSRTEINPPSLKLLKQLVKTKSGLGCADFADMHHLQKKIRQETGEYLSSQTLNRFFGIIQSDFNPSRHTLNLMARYLSCKNFQDFEILTVAQHNLPQASFASRLISSLFSSINIEEDAATGMLHIVKNAVRHLANEPSVAAEVYHEMAFSAFGRKYFFEQCIHIDGLNSVYGDALTYYLVNSNNSQQRFFAYVLSCYRYFLSCQPELFRKYFEMLADFRPSEIRSFPATLIDRYYAVLLFNQFINAHHSFENGNTENNLTDLDMLSAHSRSCYSAGFQVGEAMLLTGDFEKAWETLQLCNNSTSAEGCSAEDHKLYAAVLQLISGFYTGRIKAKKAHGLLHQLENASLPVLLRDYLSILLLHLRKDLSEDACIIKETVFDIERIIHKTGFHFMKTYGELIHRHRDCVENKN
ncbi:MAG TPA: hypothetical protein VL307_09965 [Chitinophagaceae bacterium]|nr:hypothetical protein [Chitinophagaceae bacterium]